MTPASHQTSKKERLDLLLVRLGLAENHGLARGLIMSGQVLVDGQRQDKAGTRVPPEAPIRVLAAERPYVGRGGIKLAAALDRFGLDPRGQTALDVGASTGGFTHCLLLRGARRVYAVDVGRGQLHWRLRQDPRVVVMERTHIRDLQPPAISETVDLATIDVSFISLRTVVPKVAAFVRPGGLIVALVKPQFEVGAARVGRGGIVRDHTAHQEVLAELTDRVAICGLEVRDIVPSALLGRRGNQEYFALLAHRLVLAGL